MKNNITHIILPMIVAAMACAASCTYDPELIGLESGEEMQFEVMEASDSKAIITTSKNLKNKDFMVFGDVNRTGVFYQGLQKIFTGDAVSYNSNTKKWTYEKPIYWLMGQEHSFVAVHPAPIQEIPGDIGYEDSRISFTYETPVSNYKESTDILVATHRRKYNLDNAGAVKFEFKHILTRLNFAPALEEVLMYPDETDKSKYPDNENEYIEIHRVEIYGLKTKALFHFASAPLQTGEVQTNARTEAYEVYDDSVKPIKLDFPDNTIKVTNNGQNVSVFDDDNALLLLPQSVGEDVYVILYYTVNGDQTDTESEPLIRTVTLPLAGINKWDVGKSYTYKFTIKKAYTGQIKPGSLKWTVKDLNIDDPDATGWISEDDTISQDFDKDDNSDDTE